MATVVQATCPGCKQTLRIPAGWVTQAIRCKHCGMVLQAKQAAKSSGVRPAVSGRTPPPAPRKVKAPPVVAPTVKAVPAPPPAAVSAKPTTPPPAAYPMAIPAALPSAVATAPVVPGGSPFDVLDAEGPAPTVPPGYRRGNGWWKGPAVVVAVLLTAGVATVFAWPYIRGAFELPAPSGNVAQNDANPPEVKNPPTIDTPKPPDAPVKSKDKDPRSKDKDPNPKDKDGKPSDPVVNPKDKGNPKDKDGKPNDPVKPPDPAKGAPVFPRRALVISVHNYLYANPVHAGLPIPTARNIPNFLDALNRGLHVPMTEMAHLSDGANKGARSPMKPVIEKTLTDFLDGSRAQDRVMVFFIGHAVAVGDDAYLVPIEGDLENAESLIPVKWVYEQMAKCKARQKVLVVDVNRLNPAHGLERPNGGPMDPKVDAALNAPPDGVQVWTACLAGQQSYELDGEPMGVFLDQLNTAMAPNQKAGEKGLEGKIQHPEDPLPLEQLRDFVNASLKEALQAKLEQQSRLAGAEPKDGAAYDKAEAPAPPIVLASAGPGGDPKMIQGVLDEVGMPAIKASGEDSSIRFEVLPPFPQEKMAQYPAGGEDSDLRKAVLNAREVIWALNPAAPPAGLREAVDKIRKDLKANLSVLKDGYKKLPDDMAFKKKVLQDEREVADLLAACDDALQQLKAAAEGRDKETKRWQANYDFTLARLEAQYAYLFEYQSMLGQMRKQAPDLAPGQNGWKLASQVALKGDSQGKKLAKDSTKLLEKIIADNPGTPWEVLAKREKLTALGLQWQGTTGQ